MQRMPRRRQNPESAVRWLDLHVLDARERVRNRVVVLKRVLIANRGEIACRIQRTCHRLGIETVAVYSDADANAPHVKAAHASVRLGPPPVKESYLDGGAIIQAAIATGADAIHPGYGLLSENATFAASARSAGIVFIGPPSTALEAFGDKIKARAVARSVGVEPPPGSDGPISPGDLATIEAEAARIGFPILVKAAGGGGGIGMQMVDDPAKLARAVQACSDRGKSAFADERVYMERWVTTPRHIRRGPVCDRPDDVRDPRTRLCSHRRGTSRWYDRPLCVSLQGDDASCLGPHFRALPGRLRAYHSHGWGSRPIRRRRRRCHHQRAAAE